MAQVCRHSLLAVWGECLESLPVREVFDYLILKNVLVQSEEEYSAIAGAGTVELKRQRLLDFMIQNRTNMAAFFHFANSLFLHKRELFDRIKQSVGELIEKKKKKKKNRRKTEEREERFGNCAKAQLLKRCTQLLARAKADHGKGHG